MPMTAVIADHNIIRFQVGNDPHGVGFLPQVGMCGAAERPAAVLSQDGFFEAADKNEAVVQRQRISHTAILTDKWRGVSAVRDLCAYCAPA